jgi:hypothetical protein
MSSNEALDIRGDIWPLLAGHTPDVQGAALCDLLATWLAGQIVFNKDGSINRKETSKLRETLLQNHIKHMRLLIPINENEILDNLLKSRLQ